MSGSPAASDGLIEVQILGLPLGVWAQAQEHIDELLREFTLLTDGGPPTLTRHVPARLLALVEKLERDYNTMTTEQETQLIDAAKAGEKTLDLTYLVPREAADAALSLAEALDAADEFCRSGAYLLTLATPPEAAAFRRWYLGEFVDQIAGAPPRTWSQWLARQSDS